MLIGLISDTHITAKRGSLNKKVHDAFRVADLIVHAGDITQKKVLDELELIAPVIAVKGNNDRLDLKASEVFKAGNFTFGVNHATKYSDDFEKLYKLALKLDADVLITGHTHRPHLKTVNDILLINPGSASKPVRSDASVATINISSEDTKTEDITVDFIKL